MATDTEGVRAAKVWLQNEGYTNVEQINHPVDLCANKGGRKFWIEVKYTETKEKSYFGAATTTEWECALNNPNTFFFLVVRKPGGVKENSPWGFELITPKEFIKYSTIVPLKIYFVWPLSRPRSPPNRRSAIQATKKNLRASIDFFKTLGV